jgi:hypothetical protein
MIYKTFFHKLASGINAKFTIIETKIDNKQFFYAKVINTDLDFYKKLSDFERKQYLGVNVTNGNQKTVYYSDPVKLENDLKAFYGVKWLESEI